MWFKQESTNWKKMKILWGKNVGISLCSQQDSTRALLSFISYTITAVSSSQSPDWRSFRAALLLIMRIMSAAAVTPVPSGPSRVCSCRRRCDAAAHSGFKPRRTAGGRLSAALPTPRCPRPVAAAPSGVAHSSRQSTAFKSQPERMTCFNSCRVW